MCWCVCLLWSRIIVMNPINISAPTYGCFIVEMFFNFTGSFEILYGWFFFCRCVFFGGCIFVYNCCGWWYCDGESGWCMSSFFKFSKLLFGKLFGNSGDILMLMNLSTLLRELSSSQRIHFKPTIIDVQGTSQDPLKWTDLYKHENNRYWSTSNMFVARVFVSYMTFGQDSSIAKLMKWNSMELI